jgi:hypothetical protein
MITIEEGLKAYLTANIGLAALVSGRVYPLHLPQTVTIPSLTFQRVSTPRVTTHDMSGSSGTAYPRFQFDAWGASPMEAKRVTDALRAALNGYRGTMGTADPVTVQAALIVDEQVEFDQAVELYRSRSDYTIWHLEG